MSKYRITDEGLCDSTKLLPADLFTPLPSLRTLKARDERGTYLTDDEINEMVMLLLDTGFLIQREGKLYLWDDDRFPEDDRGDWIYRNWSELKRAPKSLLNKREADANARMDAAIDESDELPATPRVIDFTNVA